MFYLTSKLPVSEAERHWVDHGLNELVSLLGPDRLTQSQVVLPSHEFFPREWEATEDWALFAFDRVCALLGVDRARVDVAFFEVDDVGDALLELMPYWSGERSPGPAGFYREAGSEEFAPIRATIAVNRSKLADPTALIATIAHELAHMLLLGDRKIDRDTEHMEPLTDLTTVFCGFGVFTANSAFNFRQWSGDRGTGGWSMSRRGYLSEPMYGYALARYAQMRGEKRPVWARRLCLNVRTYMAQSTKALEREASNKRRER